MDLRYSLINRKILWRQRRRWFYFFFLPRAHHHHRWNFIRSPRTAYYTTVDMMEQVCVAVSSRLVLLLQPPNARAREKTQLTAAKRHAWTVAASAKILMSVIVILWPSSPRRYNRSGSTWSRGCVPKCATRVGKSSL